MKKILLIKAFAFFLTTSYSQENVDTTAFIKTEKITGNAAAQGKRISCKIRNTLVEPLIVVDGEPIENKKLKDIPIEDILNIDILKDRSMLSCRSSRSGIIVITTKDANKKKIVIKDKESGEVIPGATVKIIFSGKDTVNLIANEKGEVKIEKDQKKKYYTIMASSVGYNPYHMVVNISKNNEIEMERDVLQCNEVLVRSYANSRVCYSKIRCLTAGHAVYNHPELEEEKIIENNFKTYPNPATAGSTITIEFLHPVTGDFDVKIFSLSGQMIYQTELFSKSSKLQIPLTGFVKGSYVVRVIHKQTKEAYSEKILVL